MKKKIGTATTYFVLTIVLTYGHTFFPLTDFFFIHRDVLEMNRLDNFARRSMCVGGAIADLLGIHLLGIY